MNALAVNLLNPIPTNNFGSIGKGNAIFNGLGANNIKDFWKFNYNERECKKWNRWKSIMDYTKIDYNFTNPENDIYNIISEESFNYLIEALLVKFNNIYYGYKDQLHEDAHFVEKIGFTNKNGYNNIISSDSRIILIGDIHSSFHSLLQVIETLVNRNFFEKNNDGDTILKLKPNHYIFFLGDMLDRGPYNIEVLYLCFLLQYLNIDIKKKTRQVWLINGNHEDFEVNSGHIPTNVSPMGYAEELRHQFNLSITNQYSITEYLQYYKILHFLPSAIFLKFNEKIYQLNHGGIDITQISNIEPKYKYLENILDKDKKIFAQRINKISDTCFKWYDFDNNDDNYFDEGKFLSYKSLDDIVKSGFYEGRVKIPKNILNIYLDKFNIEAVISGHQDNTSIGIVEKNNEYNLKDDDYYKDELKTLKENSDNNETHILVLDPAKDFLALTTSLATISKGVNKTTFLELYKKDLLLLEKFNKNVDKLEEYIATEEYIKDNQNIQLINQNYSHVPYKISYEDYKLIEGQISDKYLI